MLSAVAGLAMAEPASGWFLNWESTVPPEEQRLKLLNLRQEGDIEDYNGHFAELIFRVDDMGELDRVSHCIGLKHQTQSYVNLQNPLTLADAMDLAVKYEGAHFAKEFRPRQREGNSDPRHRRGDRFHQGHQQPNRPVSKRHDLSRYKPKPMNIRKLKCYFCNKPGHLKRECLKLKNANGGKDQGNGAPTREMEHHINS
ncbi:TPA: hypothetical protein N0F65_011780 [Lagenidium giganteum]|uniref:CCHC-type domain-containing protein n=1 Tax=Lagenidium giganteum TaxID=4803 RepID=A0AAV2YI49_9STRA|nr:TPA: hypothetical protein N0F65_011780 [Lagenidium giganteum]